MELRILLILICFAYLLMEPGVITKVKETNFTPFLAVDFGNSALLPKLLTDQILKLKQLTVLTLSETNKVLSYNKLQEELEVSNVRELEDFLINDCMYTGMVKGKLNQVGRCLEVQFAAERDLMHGQLGSLIDTLGNWLATSDIMLSLTEEKIDWASKMCQLNMDCQQELQGRIDEAKKNIHYKKSQNKQDLCFMEYGDGFDSLGRPLEHEDDLMRSKRSRPPHSYRRRSFQI